MTKRPRQIEFTVWHEGDPSVGDPGDSATVKMQVYSKEMLNDVVGALIETFSSIWDVNRKYIYIDHQ